MKTTESQQWLHLIAFTVAGVVVFGIMYAAAMLFISPAKDVRDYYAGVVGFTEKYIGQTPAVLPPPGEAYKDFFAIKTDETIRIGNYRVIYRGRQSGSRFSIEVADTRLDADSFYTYFFTSNQAADGILIGNQHFRVLSARSTILHLQRIGQ